MRGYFSAFGFACIIALCGFAHQAFAETIHILALGASNTNGVGVGATSAWPAQLANMLKAKGYDVDMSINAINGQDSGQILMRASQIPAGTQVVVYDNGGDNDHKHGLSAAQTQANVAQIVAAIRAHGAVPIRAPYRAVAGHMYGDNGNYQADGHHLTQQSHARVAATLVPQVIAAAHRHK